MSQTYTTPFGSQSSTTSSFSSNKKRGLLEDGTWLCECNPRNPAVCLTVRKESPNKGRRFWTCRICDFFLWESDAQEREREALIRYNCRSENGITTRVRGRDEAPPGLDLRAQRGTTHQNTPSTFSSAMATTKPAAPARQRVFKGLPLRNSASQDSDSDSISISGDDNDNNNEQGSMAQDHDLDRANGRRIGSGASESQTLHNSSSSGSKGSGSRAVRVERPQGGIRDAESDFLFRQQPPTTTIANTNHPPTTPSAKRKRPVFQQDSDDEFGGAELDDSDTERQLVAMTDGSTSRKQRQLQTQGLARSILFGSGAGAGAGGTAATTTTSSTANNNVELNGGLPTPRTNRNSLRIMDEERDRRGAKRQRTVGFAALPREEERRGGVEEEDDDDDDQGGRGGAITTPTPYRKTDALAPTPSDPRTPSSRFAQSSPQQRAAAAPSPQTPGSSTLVSTITTTTPPNKPSDYPKISDEIMSMLVGQPISENKRRTIEAALVSHEQRVKGVARGRDVLRTTLQDREARIAELQAQVTNLENALKMDRANLLGVSKALQRLSEQEDLGGG